MAVFNVWYRFDDLAMGCLLVFGVNILARDHDHYLSDGSMDLMDGMYPVYVNKEKSRNQDLRSYLLTRFS